MRLSAPRAEAARRSVSYGSVPSYGARGRVFVARAKREGHSTQDSP
ncbi:MAG TPA: hypothetical protein VHE78_02860 [Gemmatimonadaceae bacterium]|nr:hypothetical protein [Gemmatimonadaceae bacterium]